MSLHHPPAVPKWTYIFKYSVYQSLDFSTLRLRRSKPLLVPLQDQPFSDVRQPRLRRRLSILKVESQLPELGSGRGGFGMKERLLVFFLFNLSNIFKLRCFFAPCFWSFFKHFFRLFLFGRSKEFWLCRLSTFHEHRAKQQISSFCRGTRVVARSPGAWWGAARWGELLLDFCPFWSFGRFSEIQKATNENRFYSDFPFLKKKKKIPRHSETAEALRFFLKSSSFIGLSLCRKGTSVGSSSEFPLVWWVLRRVAASVVHLFGWFFEGTVMVRLS